ncbi:beta-ketoacyl-ACP synthase II [Nocardiopsis sp. MG754419]|uniref:beta-ketoacyl-ACP synthase II n=1 Tax=Nocardiopsis sp. MG754419 TaxID=2259865 RepID=UPI001BA6A50D|nr:beta-ketoacyl-ACP synthase II [Nocardiopsis sp. MG754419]MBR8743453.1 beta-ketoacyl-[acyl-carrier-protein] synthase II [Nocardiopsis sp. MG754419]
MNEAGGDRRVVITGRGVLSPLGNGWESTWDAMVRGRVGVRRIAAFDTEGLDVRIGAEVGDFDPAGALPRPLARRTGRSLQYGLVAADMALRDAGLTVDETNAPRLGVLAGSVVGPTEAVIDTSDELRLHGPAGVSPYSFAMTGIVPPAGEIGVHVGARGPTATMATACATGATCLGEGARMIREGRADIVLAGGMDAFSRFEIAVASRAGALSRRNDEPERASRPFDRDRDGFVMGSGAGMLVLESAEHARRRGARVHAELAGYGATADAHHLTAPRPDGEGVERALRTALADARVDPGDVDYVNAHGTSTPLNDAAEARVLRTVFGERGHDLPVSSTKSMTGHMLAAGGAVEAAVLTAVIAEGVVPPTVNCDDPEDVGLDLVPHQAREHRVEVAVSDSFGFGGHNAVLVLRRWRG